MKSSLRHFLAGLIDYAGLFPPASLDLRTAQQQFGLHLQGPYGWMLGRFIVPLAKLGSSSLDRRFRYSVIVPGDLHSTDLSPLSEFASTIDMVEIALPDEISDQERCREYMIYLVEKISHTGLKNTPLFLEPASASATCTIAAMAAYNHDDNYPKAIPQTGFKLRCGGVSQAAYPSTETVASAIACCQRYDIPIKFTAGLHQPLRNHLAVLDIMQHGFVNIFAAALLYWGGVLTENELRECLCDQKGTNFHFSEDGLSWRGRSLSSGHLKNLRRNRVMSFGSCSFSEPLAGLRALQYLNEM